MVKVKEGTKFHLGKVVGSGRKDEVEKLMLELESAGGTEEDKPVQEKQVYLCFDLFAVIKNNIPCAFV